MKKKTERENLEKKPFFGWEAGRFHLNFPNGNHLSTVWAEGTYTDNHDSRKMIEAIRKNKSPYGISFGSKNVEIMFSCGKKLEKKIVKKYNEGVPDPIGYLTQEDWLKIVNLLAKEK